MSIQYRKYTGIFKIDFDADYVNIQHDPIMMYIFNDIIDRVFDSAPHAKAQIKFDFCYTDYIKVMRIYFEHRLGVKMFPDKYIDSPEEWWEELMKIYKERSSVGDVTMLPILEI